MGSSHFTDISCPCGWGRGQNVGLGGFCHILTLLPPGASVFHKHMSSFIKRNNVTCYFLGDMTVSYNSHCIYLCTHLNSGFDMFLPKIRRQYKAKHLLTKRFCEGTKSEPWKGSLCLMLPV